MEINTKFNLGDSCFFMNKNKVINGNVTKISTSTMINNASSRDLNWKPLKQVILYDIIWSDSFHITLEESYLYISKEELIKTL